MFPTFFSFFVWPRPLPFVMDWGQVDLHYVSKNIDNDLMCAICISPWLDPLQTPCEHVFCKTCLTESVQRVASCPQCRNPLHLSECQAAMRLLRNKVDALEVYCHYRCGWTGARSNFVSHMRSHDCRYAADGCTWNGADEAAHLRSHHSCPFRTRLPLSPDWRRKVGVRLQQRRRASSRTKDCSSNWEPHPTGGCTSVFVVSDKGAQVYALGPYRKPCTL